MILLYFFAFLKCAVTNSNKINNIINNFYLFREKLFIWTI